MKILLTVLLFISATAAINNLVGIPDERFQQIEHILKGIQFIYLCSGFSAIILSFNFARLFIRSWASTEKSRETGKISELLL